MIEMTMRNILIRILQKKRSCLTNGLKGQQAGSPGQRPGCQGKHVTVAPQGQKLIYIYHPCPFALSGRKMTFFANYSGRCPELTVLSLSGYMSNPFVCKT